MIGIIAGLYITNFYEDRKLEKRKNQALEQVAIEITDNRDSLQVYQDTLKSLYEASQYVLPQIQRQDELVLIIHKDSLEDFIRQGQRIFSYKEHEESSADSIKLKGELGLFLTSRLVIVDLTQVTWDAYKQTSLLERTSFECLRDLEDLYTLQGEVVQFNREWRNTFLQFQFLTTEKAQTSFLQLWENLLLRQKLLLEFYEGFEAAEMIEVCG